MNDQTNHTSGGAQTPPLADVLDEKWVVLKDFATIFEVDYRTARRWVAERRVHATKIGGEIRISESEIRYIKENGTRKPTHDQKGNPLPTSTIGNNQGT